MPSVFDFISYTSYLEALVTFREARGKTRAELASAMGCQGAYLSQVLKLKVDLTEDHVARLSVFLELSDLETEYFLILLRQQKSGTSALRDYLERRRKELLQSATDLERKISSNQMPNEEKLRGYYSSSWLPSLIHLATSCESLSTAAAIAKRFNIAKENVEYHLEKLEQFGLVKIENQKWTFNGGSVHIPKNSPQDAHIQTIRRLLAIHSLSTLQENNLHYSVVLTTTANKFEQLRKRFLELIAEIHKEVEPTASEDVYSICIDLFRP